MKNLTYAVLIILIGLSAVTAIQAADRLTTYSANYYWTYNGYRYSATIDLSIGTYRYYKALPRTYDDYGLYTSEHDGHEYLDAIAIELTRYMNRLRLNRRERAEFVLAFVQAIPYVREQGEYPRYPIETLVENKGDCEDSAILACALLNALGIKCLLILYPGHMAIGMVCPDCKGGHYISGQDRYYIVETTMPGWSIGQLPPEYVDISPVGQYEVGMASTTNLVSAGEGGSSSFTRRRDWSFKRFRKWLLCAFYAWCIWTYVRPRRW